MSFVPPQIQDSLADDPEVKEALKQLTLEAIHQTTMLMKRGSPQIKAQLIRTLVPPVIKTMRVPNAEADGELKGAVEKMYDEIREGIGA